MAEREQIKKTSTERTEETVQEMPEKTKDTEALKSEIDDLLDEIDGVLEENAHEFVSQYVQKGGE